MAALFGDRRAEHAAAVLEHEIDMLGCDFLGGNDKVALVLSVFVVDDDDEFSGLEVFNGLFYCVQFYLHNYSFGIGEAHLAHCKDTLFCRSRFL